MNRVILNAIFPGEPIGYKRAEQHGARRFVPAKMRQAQANLRRALHQIAPKMKPSNVRMGLQQVFHIGPLLSNYHEPDGDNLEKLLWDAFIGEIWDDDHQIIEWQGRKELNSPSPHIHLIVYVVE
jgi:Holliday junction resolvase RusA-like endonuclease